MRKKCLCTVCVVSPYKCGGGGGGGGGGGDSGSRRRRRSIGISSAVRLVLVKSPVFFRIFFNYLTTLI